MLAVLPPFASGFNLTATFCIAARIKVNSFCTIPIFFQIPEKFSNDKWFVKEWALLVDKLRMCLYNFIFLGRPKETKGEAVLVPAEINLMWNCMKLPIAPCLRNNKRLNYYLLGLITIFLSEMRRKRFKTMSSKISSLIIYCSPLVSVQLKRSDRHLLVSPHATLLC